MLLWLTASTDLMYKGGKKEVLIIAAILYTILEISFFYLLFINTALIGKYTSPFDVQSGLFSQIYLIISLLIFEITGIILSFQSIKSENPEIKLKGKFLFLALILFLIGAAIEVLTPIAVFTIFLSRVITICSAFAFYNVFVLPEFIKRFFLKGSPSQD